MANDLKRLYQIIQYEFNDERLVKNALTHRSKALNNNERLEFLGDSILSFVISGALFDIYPDATEGELSRLRAALVKGETLAIIAKDMELGQYLLLGQGEMKSGGYRRSSILADCFEALIAAIFLDSDIHEAKRFILFVFKDRLSDKTLIDSTKDSKTRLQEYLQSKKLPLPQYALIDAQGEQHSQTFYIECSVEKLNIKVVGTGSSRRKAEKDAALKFLNELK